MNRNGLGLSVLTEETCWTLQGLIRPEISNRWKKKYIELKSGEGKKGKSKRRRRRRPNLTRT